VQDRFDILSTDATANTIRIHYDDPSMGVAVDLSDSFTPGTIFTLAGSYGQNNPSSVETNDARYVVKSVTWDGPTGSPGEVGSPVPTGDTVIEIDTDFDNIPPYNTLTVARLSNNLGSPGGVPQIVFTGDVTDILHPPGTPDGVTAVFYIDQPLVSTNPLLNALTITDVSFAGGETTVTVDQNFIDTGSPTNPIDYTGPLKLIEAKYRGNIFYDSTNVSGSPKLWEDGYILREAFRLEHYPDNVANTSFAENLAFGWGTTHRWAIIGTKAATSTILIEGDITSMLDVNDRGRIVGSFSNDGDYEVVSFAYVVTGSPSPNRTEIVVRRIGSPDTLPTDTPGTPPIHGYFELDNLDVTDWFQYRIKEARPSRGTPAIEYQLFEVWGNATVDIQSGQQFRVLSTSNDGVYTATTVTYDASAGTTDINVSGGSPEYIANNEKGGWIESYRDYGIRIVFEDSVGVSVGENATGSLVLTAGNVMDAWDYAYWDVGSWDEDLGTVIYLYSNTF